MVHDETIRKKAIRACKTYGTDYKLSCPICGGIATAHKDKEVGVVLFSCSECKRGVGFRL